MENFPNITIDDFNLICRLCLKKDKQRLTPIFKSNKSDNENEQNNSLLMPTNRMIAELCGLEVDFNLYL